MTCLACECLKKNGRNNEKQRRTFIAGVWVWVTIVNPQNGLFDTKESLFLGTLVQHDPTHTQFFSTSEPFELIYFKGTAHRRNLPQDGTYTPDPRPSVGGND